MGLTFYMRFMIGLATALLFFFNQGNKSFNFSGTITSIETNEGISGASVVSGKQFGTTTDTAGRFLLKGIKPGKHTFQFRCPGYYKKDTVIYFTHSDIQLVHIQLKKKNNPNKSP